MPPVWYEYSGEELHIIAGSTAAKVRNIRRDPRVPVSIASPEEPYKYVLIAGEARVTDSHVKRTTLSLCLALSGSG